MRLSVWSWDFRVGTTGLQYHIGADQLVFLNCLITGDQGAGLMLADGILFVHGLGAGQLMSSVQNEVGIESKRALTAYNAVL
ncbi:hypothetical protein N656DRAFT_778969 [Canariomyces notabilis]|uniref:Uncharacterized protein n=1 Tax=Canariomyces notabilis TaxID=2074819 RepID=A0AAN6YSC5_9PEZI|nr:hypothetical protein N656DRAFT_778969 [Canariomyces arenarius]